MVIEVLRQSVMPDLKLFVAEKLLCLLVLNLYRNMRNLVLLRKHELLRVNEHVLIIFILLLVQS